MFTRVTKSAHVCLRCQRRLLKNGAANPSLLKAKSPLRRWQSSAAAKLEEEEDDEAAAAEHNQDFDRPPRIIRVLDPAYRFLQRPRTAKLGVNSFGQPAEVLILDAFDRTLPTAFDDTADQDCSGTTLQESLDSENAPLDLDSLHRAIGQVYHKFVAKRDDLTAELTLEEYDLMKKQIMESFTLEQIRHYLNAHSPRDNSLQENPTATLPASNTRSALVRRILTEVWKLVLPIDAIRQRARGSATTKAYFYHARDEAELEHLLTDRRQPLNTIAKEKHVTIEVFRQQRRVKVSGTRQDAQEGVQAISRFVKRKLESVVVHFAPEHSVYADPSMRNAVKMFLKRVQEKYQLHIVLRKSDIKIVHHSMPRAAKEAAREIRIAGERRPGLYEMHVCEPHHAEQTSLERFPTPSEFGWEASHRPWHRLLATDTVRSTLGPAVLKPHHKHNAATILQKLKLFFGSGNALSAPTKRDDYRFQVTATIGQALFQSKQVPPVTETTSSMPPGGFNGQSVVDFWEFEDPPIDFSVAEELEANDFEALDGYTLSKITSLDQPSPFSQEELRSLDDYVVGKGHRLPPYDSADLKGNAGSRKADLAATPNALADPAFSSAVPYTLQQLATLSPWKEPTANAQPDVVTAPSQTVYRLEFVSTVVYPRYKTPPSFELYVSSTARDHKSQRPLLKVLRLSAIHEERAFYALCPRHQVDIKFTQQLKHDLVTPHHETPDDHKKLRSAFIGYFASAQLVDQHEWVFRPSLDVPINSNMRSVARKIRLASPDQENNTAPETSTSEPKVEATEDGKTDQKLEYYLRSAEVVDLHSHSIPIPTAPKGSSTALLNLDNVTFSGFNDTRQELRLSDRSLFSSPNLKQQDLTILVNGALGLAENLGHTPVKEDLETQIASFIIAQDHWGDKSGKDRLKRSSKSKKGSKLKQKKVHNEKITPSSVKIQPVPTKISKSKSKKSASVEPTRTDDPMPLVRPGRDDSLTPGADEGEGPTASKTSNNKKGTSPLSASGSKSGPKSKRVKSKAAPKSRPESGKAKTDAKIESKTKARPEPESEIAEPKAEPKVDSKSKSQTQKPKRRSSRKAQDQAETVK